MVTISGTETADFLRLVPMREISDQSYEETASVGGREVSNGSVAVLGVPEFLAALAAFADTRSGQAVLEGTYEFRRVAPTPSRRRGRAATRGRAMCIHSAGGRADWMGERVGVSGGMS
ncbi:MAG: hypothetical protein WBC44_06815 [Planctomycetaceae bacterium]